MQRKLDEKEESAINLQETYVSLQQEVDIKTKKLKKVLWERFILWKQKEKCNLVSGVFAPKDMKNKKWKNRFFS